MRSTAGIMETTDTGDGVCIVSNDTGDGVRIISNASVCQKTMTYLDLGPPVPLGASGDEKSPSLTVTGDPAGSMPADTHLY